MVEYEGYYDASGSQTTDADPLAVAGIVASRNAWAAINSAWDGVLRNFGVAYLHMKEFAQSKGPFATWKGDETKRGKFLAALTDTLKGRIDYGMVIDVLPSAIKAVDQQYQLTTTDYWSTPYMFVTTLSITRAMMWLAQERPTSTGIHFVEHGDAGQGPLAALARRFQAPVTVLPKIEPTTDRHLIPFQVADFVAYEHYLFAKRERAGTNRRLRRSLEGLLKATPIRSLTMSQDGLLAWCRNHPDMHPPRAAIVPNR